MAGNEDQREAFQASYRAWKAATDAFDARMQRTLAGEPFEGDVATQILELDAMRNDFMEKSRPFVSWKP